MLRFWTLFIAIVGVFGLAQDDVSPTPCEERAQRQIDLDNCASEEFKNAEAFMAQTLKAIHKQHHEDPAFLQALMKTQEAWITFRDAEMLARFPHKDNRRYYGSILGMCWNKELARLTRERTKTLRRWLEGVPQGDACGGSYPIAAEPPQD